MVESRKEEEYKLEFKKWDDYFRSQTLLGDNIQILEEAIYLDKKSLVLYFNKLRTLVNRNKSYMRDFSKVKIKLDNIGKKIYASEFIQQMKNDAIRMNATGVDFILPDKDYTKMVDDLTQIFRDINVDFSVMGINPNIIKSIKKKQSKEMQGVGLG